MSLFDNCTGRGDKLANYLEALTVSFQSVQLGATSVEQAIADFQGNVPGDVAICQTQEGQLGALQQALEAYEMLLTGKGKEPLPIVLLYMKYPLLIPLASAKEAIERVLRHLAVYTLCCTQMTVLVLEQRNMIYKQLQKIHKEVSELIERSSGFEERALLEHQRLALSTRSAKC